jgi:hypothetical protein
MKSSKLSKGDQIEYSRQIKFQARIRVMCHIIYDIRKKKREVFIRTSL